MKLARLWIMAAAVFAVMAMGALAMAEETKKSATGSVSWMTNYMWRGQRLSTGAVIQPTIGVTYGSVGMNLWANYDQHKKETTETDFTLNYATSFDKIGLEAGYIYYSLNADDNSQPIYDNVDPVSTIYRDTQEVYVKVSYDYVVKPSVTWYYDFDEGTGHYILMSLDYSKSLNDDASVAAYARAGYLMDNYYVGYNWKDKENKTDREEYSDFHNGELGVSASMKVNKDITVTPLLAYSFPLTTKGKEGMQNTSYARDSEQIYGGITASLGF